MPNKYLKPILKEDNEQRHVEGYITSSATKYVTDESSKNILILQKQLK